MGTTVSPPPPAAPPDAGSLNVDSVLARLRKQQQTTPAPGLPQAPSPAFRPIVMAESGGHQFNPDGTPLESQKLAGQPDAPVGAAQVRPSTARDVLAQAGIPLDENRLRTDEKYNVAVGEQYHSILARQFGNNPVLTNAAYNAGPARVQEWIKQYGDPRKGEISDEDFASHIPYPETQAYLHATGAVHGDYSSVKPPTKLPFDTADIFRDLQARMYGSEADASEELKGVRAAMDRLTAPPEKKTTPPNEVWGSMAMALAAVGGLLTHTPLATSMNAMAGVLNGFKASDAAAVKASMDQWKASQDAVLKVTELRMKMYESAMKKMADAPETAKAELAANAAALQDTAVQEALAKGDTGMAMAIISGGYTAAVKMQQEGFKFQQSVNDRLESMRLLKDLQDARTSGDPAKVQAAQQALADHWASIAPPAAATKIELPPTAGGAAAATERDVESVAASKIAAAEKANGAPLTEPEKAQTRLDVRNDVAGEKKRTVDAAGAISDDAADLAADRVLAGDERATTGMARSNANITKVTNSIVKLARERHMDGAAIAAKVAEFQGTMAGERTLGTRTANMEIAANEVKNMAPLALAASKKVSRTDYPSLNRIIIAGEQGTGDENVVRFGLAANSLIYTYAKFLNPTGIPTDADKAKATDILSTAWTEGQFGAAVDQIKREIASGQSAIKDTHQEFRQGVTGGAAPQASAGAPPMQGARQAPDGKWYVPDPQRPGKYLMVQ